MGSKVKAQKRKEKLKQRKVQFADGVLHRQERCATVLMELCAEILPGYIDDSCGADVVGRKIVWQIGMVAWNAEITGTAISDQYLRVTNLDEAEREIIRKEVAGLMLKKRQMFPGFRTTIAEISVVVEHRIPHLKVKLGAEIAVPVAAPSPPVMPDPPLSEQIMILRTRLGWSQVKFGEYFGVSAKIVSAWEHAKRLPDETQQTKMREL